MATMKAIKIQEPGKAAVVETPIPKLRDDYVLVQTKAVSLNPTDWKHIAFLPHPTSTVGCDYSGIIISSPPQLTALYPPGTRIAGFVHGSNAVEPSDGSFAQTILAKPSIALRVPDWMSDEDASSLGVGISTVGQGLYQEMGLARPDAPLSAPPPADTRKEYILIYGGSTATGTLGIQFAALSGYTVLTTCSPRNFDLVKSLGAAAAFDYNDPSSVSKIREYTDGKLRYAWDTISEASSAQFCADVLADTPELAGGDLHYGALLFLSFPRKDVITHHTLAYTMLGEAFRFGTIRDFEARPEDLAFGVEWWKLAEKLVAEKKIRPHPVRVGKGGLEGVLEGLEELKSGKVSGVKLCYRIE